MEVKTLLTTVILAIGFVACNSSDEVISVIDNNESSENTHLILKQLKEVNDSISQKHISSRANPKNVLLASADICGALEGGRWGIKDGSFLGSMCPDIGTIGGGFIGCLIGSSFGSIGASYVEYCRQNCGGYSIILPKIDDVAKVYCMNYDLNANNGSYNNDFENILELPFGLDSLENVGKYHNLSLTTLINSDNGVVCLGNGDDLSNPYDDVIEGPGTLIKLSDFERDVIYSESYIMDFNQYMKALAENGGYRVNGSDVVYSIINLYIEAIECYNGVSDINDVVSLTNDYIYLIDVNDELSEIEKYHVYIALTVGVYSYKFWANYNEENNE